MAGNRKKNRKQKTTHSDDNKIIKNVLDVFQKVLNHCYTIDDDDWRLPADLIDQSNAAINAATVKYQPEKLRENYMSSLTAMLIEFEQSDEDD